MKKFCLFLICLVLMPIIFAGCAENANPYQSLINCIIEEQNNSDDLYNDYIKITGTCYASSNGYKSRREDYSINLQDIIITENSILERYNDFSYYYLFTGIENIKDSSGNILWSKN